MLSTKIGTRSPAMVPIPLDIPIRILAYLGAISRWLTLKPEMANPLQATPIVRATVAAVGFLWVVAFATTRKNIASIPKPPQLKSFRTLVVDIIPRFLKWSASRPPHGTIIVISKWGRDPITPLWKFYILIVKIFEFWIFGVFEFRNFGINGIFEIQELIKFRILWNCGI